MSTYSTTTTIEPGAIVAIWGGAAVIFGLISGAIWSSKGGSWMSGFLLGALPPAACMLAVLLAGCGGNGAKPAPTDPVKAWCELRIGEAESQVTTAMGDGNGHRGDAYAELAKGIGLHSAEWDVGDLTLVAGFDGSGSTQSLQAYDGTPDPATVTHRLPCAAIRDAHDPNGLP